MDTENVGYENADLCARCGGACCKNSPGLTHPSDWPTNLVSALAGALESGRYAIDWHEREGAAEEAIYYVRPAVIQARHYPIKEMVYHGAWGGRFRVDPAVTRQAPHRSGLAQLRHPVLQ